MRISAKSHYACKALAELAGEWPNPKPLNIEIIAKKNQIPAKYLAQILIQLKNAGIVKSLRGQEGGYVLAKAPGQISLAEVLRLLGEPIVSRPNTTKKFKDKDNVFAGIWEKMDRVLTRALEEETFDRIGKIALRAKRQINYYI